MRSFHRSWSIRLAGLLLVVALLPLAEVALVGADDAGQVLIAVGDLADCGDHPKDDPDPQKSRGVAAVAELLARELPANGRLVAIGDLAYETGTPEQFQYCYDRYLGQFKGQTYPVPGNHEYYYQCRRTSRSCDAAPYFAYFGDRAGEPGRGYYAYDYAGWHIVALNSNGSQRDDEACGWIACDAKSAQGRWLKRDLRTNTADCTLAYWHHPRFSSGNHGNNPRTDPLWRILSQAGADVVLNGHSHDYERFAPLDAKGKRDAKRGMRQFVVGTGGAELTDFARPLKTSQGRAERWGVLKLTLFPDRYDWEFITTPGDTVDRGSGQCH